MSAGAPKPTPPRTAGAVAVEFLKALDPDGRHNIVRFDPAGGPPCGRTFEPGEWTKIAAHVDEWAGSRNLYYSVNEPRRHAPDGKLRNTDITALRAIVADVDLPGGNGDAEIRSLRATVDKRLKDAAAPMPTFWTDSGGGLQLIWIFPAKLGRDHAEAVKAVGLGVGIRLHGDSVSDISRIMRLPGTMNLPNAKKQARGRVARGTAVLGAMGERHEPAAIAAAIPPVAASVVARYDADETIARVQNELKRSEVFGVYSPKDWPAELAAKFEAATNADTGLAALWSGAKPPTNDQSRSGYRAALAYQVGRLGWTVEEYAMLALAWARTTWDADDWDAERMVRALARDWVHCALPVHPETIAAKRFDPEAEAASPGPVPTIPSAPTESSGPGPDASGMFGAEPRSCEIVDIFGHDDPGELGTPPTGSLPPVVARWARSEARRKGVSEAFAAVSAVAVASAAIGNSIRLQVKQRDTGWTEPASLWAVLIAPPGSAKSAIIAAAAAPLQSLEKQFLRDWTPKHAEWRRQSDAHKRSKKADVPEPGPEPILKRVALDNFTVEGAIRLFAQNPRGLICTPDELIAMLGGFGAYKRSGEGDQAQVLRFFDGGPVKVDRAGAGLIHADSALLGVLASSQPAKMRELADKLGSDGLLQRFVFVMPDGRDRHGLDEEPDADACDAYGRAVTSLATDNHGREAVIRIAPDAAAVREDGLKRLRALKSLFGFADAFGGHVEKYDKFLARIILTFHCLDETERFGRVDPAHMVSAATVKRAVAFAAFIMRHSIEFYREFVGQSDTSDDIRAIAGHLLAHPEKTRINLKAIYDPLKQFRGSHGHKRGKVACFELDTAGWVHKIPLKDANYTDAWRVEPAIHSRFAAHARRETIRRNEAQKKIEATGAARRWVNGQPGEGADDSSQPGTAFD